MHFYTAWAAVPGFPKVGPFPIVGVTDIPAEIDAAGVTDWSNRVLKGCAAFDAHRQSPLSCWFLPVSVSRSARNTASRGTVRSAARMGGRRLRALSDGMRYARKTNKRRVTRIAPTSRGFRIGRTRLVQFVGRHTLRKYNHLRCKDRLLACGERTGHS